jgi:hypothetical protein
MIKYFYEAKAIPRNPLGIMEFYSVIKNRSDKNNYRTESAHGAHFLILLAGNNKEIASSYPMKEEIETFIALNQYSLMEDEVIAKSIQEENNLVPTSRNGNRREDIL